MTVATPLRVRATRAGLYGGLRRREGDVFDLMAAGDFSDRWMVRVQSDEPLRRLGAQEALDQFAVERNPLGRNPRLHQAPIADQDEPGLADTDFDPFDLPPDEE